jgi:hypothetical protein
VREVASNVGQALQTAMRGIEQANPHTLYGILVMRSGRTKTGSRMRCCEI